MKIKDGFIKTEIADKKVVIPVGDKAVDFSGLIVLNETGAFLWELLLKDTTRDELLKALCDEYDIRTSAAAKDIDAFLKNLKEKGFLCE